MLADSKVVRLSLSDVPAVVLYEKDRGTRVAILYVLVRTDYEETEEQAIKRAHRVADQLTDALARKKTGGVAEQVPVSML